MNAASARTELAMLIGKLGATHARLTAEGVQMDVTLRLGGPHPRILSARIVDVPQPRPNKEIAP